VAKETMMCGFFFTGICEEFQGSVAMHRSLVDHRTGIHKLLKKFID
jgi:hypothetical protein